MKEVCTAIIAATSVELLARLGMHPSWGACACICIVVLARHM